jgi:hypothetical protein
MRTPALVPPHVPMAEAARVAAKHGFVLRTVRHEGRLRIAMVRPDAPDAAVEEPPPPAPDAV